ncbi:GTP binding protein-like protein Bud4 [Phyllosticta citrichinensis]|uniref:GTP binding protein-like protein Bud4 n=1 Tax=Phyllosticta citrichinensis TaxID=1130410 RepID=A0ABR1XKD9_9PEZI
MPTEAVEPLRPSKNTPTTSPVKKMANSPGPLRELSPMERRRNSPSYNQLTKKPVGARDTSPLDTSPFGASNKHRFWQSRDPNSPSLQDSENSFDATQTLSPKRNSIENLMKASRVKNSTMFARETRDHYDPTKLPVVERPLAANRPLSAQGYVPRGFDPLRNRENLKTHHRGESEPKIPSSTSKINGGYVTNSPPKPSTSPLRSSLSRNGRFSQGCDNDSSVLSSDDEYVGDGPARPLRRHAKSVTFEAKPPVINEYEMVTPEPSLASREGSYESGEEEDEEDYEFEGDSMDRDDSFDASLEDTDKTPVVLPEDWRHMSPEAANHDLADNFEDPFTSKDSDAGAADFADGDQLESARERSHSSDGEQRPLPPLPQFQSSPPDTPRGRRESNDGIAAAAERVSNAHRTLPSPPRVAANFSKADILSIGRASMTLEDRLDLMGIKDSREGIPTKALEAAIDLQDNDDKEQPEGNSALESFNIPPISREAIMERVKSGDYDDYNYTEQASMMSERNYGDVADYEHDPDVPLQSREVSSNFDVDVPDLPITAVKLEDGESGFDLNSIPEFHTPGSSPGRGSSEREGSVIHHDISGNDADSDDGSHYSSDDVEEKPSQLNSTDEDDGPPTPKADSVAATEAGELVPKSTYSKVDGLPDFGSFENVEDFHLQLQSYLGKSRSPPPAADAAIEAAPRLEPDEDFLQRPVTPPEQTDDDITMTTESDDPGTPESVIRHPIQPQDREDSEVDEPVATIKAPGGTLKTRTSSTPSDFTTMAATRRQVSGERPPPIPEKHTGRLSLTAEIEEPSQLSHVSEERSSEMGSEESHGSDWETKSEGGEPKRRRSFKMKLDFPMGDIGEDLSFDLDREFDRVVESQKKGYLMRQNTKIVYASSRKFSDEGSSDNSANASTTSAAPTTERGLLAPPGSRPSASTPRKSTRERSNTWTTEPWIGKTRRRSVRNPSTASIGDGRPKSAAGPMPPLPGQESAVNSGDMSMIDESEENMEKGRLFVKVVGVKDLEMPLPRNEKTCFQLTLDNGLHCVTTAWLDLARDAAIGQEFELVVLNDLEFQLTLQTKLQAPPKPKVSPPTAPAPKPSGHKKTNSAFGRLLQSPKKRKEAERKQQEEVERAAALKAQQEREAAKRANTVPTAWDLLHDLVGPDGSFARAYVCLKNYERQSYGRQFEVDVPCFNEWAIEEDPSITSSVKSKRGGVVRRPPYKIGKLTLQLLYVPKPKNAKDEDMPKSMNSCIREIKEAEELKSRIYEGHLSQQGGDCPYWRRRFFRLAGNKLTAFHETTRQPRATINLAKAAKLIDDHSTLKQKEAGCRRKSGFAEEDEGYAFVEEGFRIRFRNGETIDFYADNPQDKEGWMKVLGETINGSLGACKPWTELVFQKEKAERAAAKATAAARANGQANSQPSNEPNSIQQQARARPQSTFEPGQQQHARVQHHPSPVRSPPATYNRTAPVGASPDKRRPISELNPGPAAPSVAVQKGSGGSAAARYLGKMGERRRGNIKSMIF